MHPTTTSAAPQVPQETERFSIIAGVVLGAFLAALDTTILATVMPTIVGDLGGLDLYSWVFSVYMLLTAVSMPLWGKLSDVWGKKTLFSLSVVLFLLGSFLCGASQNMLHLIVFRGVQGIGAGGLASVPYALVSTVFPPHERGKALGVLASAWGISSIIGPLLGSAIVAEAHWRWVFYVNIPLGVVSVILIARKYHEIPPLRKEPIDYQGATLLAVSIVALLLFVLEIGQLQGGPSVGTWLYLASAILFSALFLRRERAAPRPLIELALFSRRAFWVGNLLGFSASFAMYGIIAFVPLFAQSVQGGTALRAGLVITPMSLSWSTASVVAGRLTHTVGENALIRFGMLMMAIGFILALFIGFDSSMVYIALCVVTVGIGMGSQTPALMLSVQHSVPSTNIGVATSTHMLARTIGGAVGVAVMGSAVTGSMLHGIGRMAEKGELAGVPPTVGDVLGDPQKLLSPQMRALLTDEQLLIILQVFTDALRGAFLIGLAVVLAAAAVSALLPPSTLHIVRKRERWMIRT